MELPSYWLSRPSVDIDGATRAAFDAILDTATSGSPGATIEYPLKAPRWQFLCYAAEQRGFALHGSPRSDIVQFKPRQPQDLNAFGAQNAVYAASDGIWPMFFAIVDREHYSTAIINACVRLVTPDGAMSGPYYMFSVGGHVLPLRPWRTGYVYLLPRDTFVPEPPFPFGPLAVHTAQLASLSAVTSLAKLPIAPGDFPFLAQMLAEYSAALRAGMPWPNAEGRVD